MTSYIHELLQDKAVMEDISTTSVSITSPRAASNLQDVVASASMLAAAVEEHERQQQEQLERLRRLDQDYANKGRRVVIEVVLYFVVSRFTWFSC